MKASSAAVGRVAVRADDRSPGAELAQPKGLLGFPAGGHAAAGVAGTPVAGDQDSGDDRGGQQDELGGGDTRVHRDGPGDLTQLVGRKASAGSAFQQSAENVGDRLGAMRPHPSAAPQGRSEPETDQGRQRDSDQGATDRGNGQFRSPADRLRIATPEGRRHASALCRWWMSTSWFPRSAGQPALMACRSTPRSASQGTGSKDAPSARTSKCRWTPVLLPVEP